MATAASVNGRQAITDDDEASHGPQKPESAPLTRHPVAVGALALALGSLAAVSYHGVGNSAISAFMAIVLILVAATDLERRLIPNQVVLPAAAIVLSGRLAFFPAHWSEYLLGAIGAAVAFLIPNLISSSLMGMGDVKLALLLGAGLGWGAVGAIVVAFLSLFPFAVGTVIRGGIGARKTTLPFGPFLAFGGLVILIVPQLSGMGAG